MERVRACVRAYVCVLTEWTVNTERAPTLHAAVVEICMSEWDEGSDSGRSEAQEHQEPEGKGNWKLEGVKLYPGALWKSFSTEERHDQILER